MGLNVLLAAVFFDLLAVAIVIPLIPYYVKLLGMDPTLYGVLGSMFGAAQLLGGPIMGNMSDKYGRKFVLIISCIGACIAYLLLGFASSIPMLFISRLLVGFCKQTVTAASAFIADITETDQRAAQLGKLNTALAIAFIIGPPLGGKLSAQSQKLPVLVAGSLFALELVLMLSLAESLEKKSGAPEEHGVFASVSKQWSAIKQVWKIPGLAKLMCIATVLVFEQTLAFHSLLIALEARYGVTVEQNSYVVSYNSVLGAIVQYWAIGPVTRSMRTHSLVTCFALVLAVGRLCTALAPTLTIWLCASPAVILASGILRTSMTASISRVVPPAELGTMLGLQDTISALARLVAPLISGIALSAAGPKSPDLLASVVMLVVFLFIEMFGDELVIPDVTADKLESSSSASSGSASPSPNLTSKEKDL